MRILSISFSWQLCRKSQTNQLACLAQGESIVSLTCLFAFLLVCVRTSVPKRIFQIAGAVAQSKLLMSWEDITADHRDVPADQSDLTIWLHP